MIEGLDNLLKAKSKISEDNVLAATAASISREQFESEEFQHAIQLSLGSLTTKLRSMKQGICKILNIGWKESQGKRFYQNQLG